MHLVPNPDQHYQSTKDSFIVNDIGLISLRVRGLGLFKAECSRS